MINRKNTYKYKSNNETDDKKAKSALQHCSRNNVSRTPGPAVLTALRKPAAFALLICIVVTAILGCSGGESLTPVKPERSAEQTDSPVPNPIQVLSGDYIPPVQTPLPLPADDRIRLRQNYNLITKTSRVPLNINMARYAYRTEAALRSYICGGAD